jgi:hypothetical protein
MYTTHQKGDGQINFRNSLKRLGLRIPEAL